MHDLMHDLAVSVAGEIFCAPHFPMKSISGKTKHVKSQEVSSMLKAKTIRSAIIPVWGYDFDHKDIKALVCNLRCLRYLDLSRKKISVLPNSISKLKHLRHLDLSGNDIEKLPNSITNLHNLEVLDLEDCERLKQLPSNITRLCNLTDLENEYCRDLSHMPRGIGKLTKLEKLPVFVIARDRSMIKHVGGLNELHSLNNLRGGLEIKNLSYVRDAASEFMEANLRMKKKLEKLTLDWRICNNSLSAADEEKGMEALCPHPNLKQLEVLDYRGVKPPSWLPSLINLVSVSFRKCISIERLPPFDGLLHLKELKISSLTSLKLIDVENGGESFFPSLTDLTLYKCPNLKGFERREALPCFPCLSRLKIDGCPNLTCLPFFPELNDLESDGDGMKAVMEILKMQTESTSFSTLYRLQYLKIENKEDDYLENELLQCLPSLQHLVFDGSSLTGVCSDEKDDGMHWQSLKVLHSVAFRDMGNLVGLPKGLQYVTSLQDMEIHACPSLACIPEWMPKLTALKELTINFSPKLGERCRNNKADDWPYISHIPNIYVDGTQIQRDGCYLI